MDILVACETSGRVRDAFIARGHNAWSCDLSFPEKGSKHNSQHFLADALYIANLYKWDMVIAFPPCTYICSSGLWKNKRERGRTQKTDQALAFVLALMQLDIPKIAIENPTGCISTRIRKPDQIIQPYYFGDDASKATCLWLKNLPELRRTDYVDPRLVNGKARWGNQTDSGQNKLGPGENRATERSRTYQGIANAMAAQWG